MKVRRYFREEHMHGLNYLFIFKEFILESF